MLDFGVLDYSKSPVTHPLNLVVYLPYVLHLQYSSQSCIAGRFFYETYEKSLFYKTIRFIDLFLLFVSFIYVKPIRTWKGSGRAVDPRLVRILKLARGIWYTNLR